MRSRAAPTCSSSGGRSPKRRARARRHFASPTDCRRPREMSLRVKVCGLTEAASLREACRLGASFLGFVFHPASPRAVTPEQAGALAGDVPAGVQTVAVLVDPDDASLELILRHL